MMSENSQRVPIKPAMWLDPDGKVQTNIPPGHVLVREMRMVDGKPVCVGERFDLDPRPSGVGLR